MLNLDDYSNAIISEFIQSIDAFTQEHGNPKNIGIYSNPINGWISFCFNLNSSIEKTGMNCPDFEFVEYRLMEIEDWESEYNNEIAEIKTNSTSTKKINIEEDGDDVYNKIFFEYLCKLISKNLNQELKGKILVQMLDSEYLKTV